MYKVDCKWGEWQTTSKCSKDCGGQRHEKREQVQHAMYGGKQCPENPGHSRIEKCCHGCPDQKCPGKNI